MEEKNANRNRLRKKAIAFILVLVLIGIGAVGLRYYLRYKETHIETDDAFVDGRIHVIASKVSGTVKALRVNDNQFIKKNEPLLEIDPADYDVRVREARSAFEVEKERSSEIRNRVDTAKKQLAEIVASSEAARANVELQKANLELAKVNLERSETLLQKQVIPRQQYDNAKTTYDVATAQLKSSQNLAKQVEAALETQRMLIKQTESGLLTQEAQIQQREAVLHGARLNLGYTKLCAPADGYITKRTVEIGNQIQAGQPLMSVVPLSREEIWITANYKETQLEKVRPGQKVEIKVDTFPGKTFNGRVESIMSGTGGAFSLFPPENATGNYVKIVQRVPVKIVLEKGEDTGHLLRIGMSVVPTILVER
jgi:membrane fusion protein (multidrug efflux system)